MDMIEPQSTQRAQRTRGKKSEIKEQKTEIFKSLLCVPRLPKLCTAGRSVLSVVKKCGRNGEIAKVYK